MAADYHKSDLPDNPKLTTREVLIGLVDDGYDTLTVNLVSQVFGITIKNADQRVRKLKGWGCIRVISKPQPRKYEVTGWGKKMAKLWKEKYKKEGE